MDVRLERNEFKHRIGAAMRIILRSGFSACIAILFLTVPAAAEAWRVLTQEDSGSVWVYDADFSFVDTLSGRVMAAYALTSRDQLSKPQAGWRGGSSPAMIEAMDCARNVRTYAGLNFGKGPRWSTGWRDNPTTAPDTANLRALMAAVCAQRKNLVTRPAGG